MSSDKGETQFTMDRIRLESIEKRRIECSNLIKARKRKLSELYCVSRLPLLPISNDQVLQIEDKLMSFLERNDLENGHEFSIAILANEKQQPRRSPQAQSQVQSQSRAGSDSPVPQQIAGMSSTPPSDVKPQDSNSIENPSTIINTNGQTVDSADEPNAKRQKLDETQQPSQIKSVQNPTQITPQSQIQTQTQQPLPQPQSQTQHSIQPHGQTQVQIPPQSQAQVQVPQTQPVQSLVPPPPQQQQQPTSTEVASASSVVITERHVESSEDEEPTLSTLIRSFSANKQPLRVDDKSVRDLDYQNTDINKLIVMLMPENKPHKVPEANSLTELYYHQQTLPLAKLLIRTHKSLTTDAYESALVEGKVQVLYSRMEELKRKNNWSLRQPKRFVDPFVQKGQLTHWDYLLSEMKWLSTDMKEERKYKLVQCYYMAQAVMDYWSYGKVCCIKRKPIKFLDDDNNKEVTDEASTASNEGQGEVSSNVANGEKQIEDADVEMAEDPNEESSTEKMDDEKDTDSADEVKDKAEKDETEETEKKGDVEEEDDDEEEAEMVDAKEELDEEDGPSNPAAATIDVSKLIEKVDPSTEFSPPQLPEFSMEEYEAASKKSSTNMPFKLHANLDEFNKTDLAIIANLPPYMPFNSNEKHHVIENSEYGHISSMLPPVDEEAEFEKVLLKKHKDTEKHGSNYQKGLFGPISYRRFNILKPPMPPSIKNLELRIPTIWLPQDDKYLIRYVTEFSFNWNIISAHLSPKPTNSYTSNIERRTPWQCFERYIQLNDKFQFSDMRGMYSLVAREWLEAAHKVQTTTKRRISPLGVGIESIQRGHRRLRWGSMFDAMRKLIRKRENITKPSQQQRKFNSDEKRNGENTPTPAQLSKLKFERDKAIQEAYLHQTTGGGVAGAPGSANFARNNNVAGVNNNNNNNNNNNRNQIPMANNNGNNQIRQQQQPQQQPISGQIPIQGGNGGAQTQAQIQAQLQAQKRAAAVAAVAAANGQLPIRTGNGGNLSQQVGNNNVNNSPQVSASALAAAVARNNSSNNAMSSRSASSNMGIMNNNGNNMNQMRSNSQGLPGGNNINATNIANNNGNLPVRSSTPNGTPYTPEQVQQLLQYQRQRQLLQQQQQQQQQQKGVVGGTAANGTAGGASLTPTPMQVLQNANNNSSNGNMISGNSSPMNNNQINMIPQSRSNSQVLSQQGTTTNGGGAGISSPTPAPTSSSSIGNQGAPQQQQQSPPAQPPKLNFTTSQVSAIINQIQTQNPKLSKEQVTKLAVAYLANYQQTQNRASAAAAAAAVANSSSSSSSASTVPASSPGQVPLQQQQIPQKPIQQQGAPQPLTQNQINAYLANPNITPQQRKQLQLLQKQNIQRQMKMNEQHQQQQQGNSSAINSPSITPQRGNGQGQQGGDTNTPSPASRIVNNQSPNNANAKNGGAK